MKPTFSWLYGPTPPAAERCCPGCGDPQGVGSMQLLGYSFRNLYGTPSGECPFCPPEES